MAPTLFGIFFSILLNYAFQSFPNLIFVHTRHDSKLLNLSRLRAKTKTTRVPLREIIFDDDAAFISHTYEGPQRLIDRLNNACQYFGLTIYIKKTEIMAQGKETSPAIQINGTTLAVVDTFKYLGSNISGNLSLDPEINARIGKAASVMLKLSIRVLNNRNLSLNKKPKVYPAGVLSTMQYGSKT